MATSRAVWDVAFPLDCRILRQLSVRLFQSVNALTGGNPTVLNRPTGGRRAAGI